MSKIKNWFKRGVRAAGHAILVGSRVLARIIRFTAGVMVDAAVIVGAGFLMASALMVVFSGSVSTILLFTASMLFVAIVLTTPMADGVVEKPNYQTVDGEWYQ